MFKQDMTVMLVLKDVTLKPKVVSLGAVVSNNLLTAIMTGYSPNTVNYCFEIDLGKDVHYHDMNGTGILRVYGTVGDFTRLNATYHTDGKELKFTLEIHPLTGSPFQPLNAFLDKIQAWDTLQTFNPLVRTLSAWTVRSVNSDGIYTDNPNGTDRTSLARLVARRLDPVGYPKGSNFPNNYLGVSEPVNTPAYRTGKAIYKNYMCQCCGNIQSISTNHEGSCWAYCNACSWKPTAYGELFIYNRLRPFITQQLASIILDRGVQDGLVYYEYLTTENEREAN